MARTHALLLGLVAALGAGPAAEARVRVHIDDSRSAGVSRLALGATHTQHSLDPWGDPFAVARGKVLLRSATTFQNQAIYGWGTRNPNPAPGEYDFHSLDRRIRLIRSMGAKPVITLCCAPDWMTSEPEEREAYPNLPPLPEHVDAFARLAARVARRYPDVRHFLVWNEMKGLWDRAADNWDYRRYTDLYNRVHAALKRVDRRIKVGGPYLVIEGTGSERFGADGYAAAEPVTERDAEVLDHWMEHKRGADFVAIDRKTVSRSHDDHPYTRRQKLWLTGWFGDVVRDVRARTDLPVWLVEDYFTGDPDWHYQAAGLASMLREELLAGASVSLRWGPQGRADGPYRGNDQSLFSDTRRATGGRPFPAWSVYHAFHTHFGRGTRLVRARSSSRSVQVVASRAAVLLVNRRSRRVRVLVDGRRVALGGYGVRALRRP